MVLLLVLISGCFASEPFALSPGGKNVRGVVSPLADLTRIESCRSKRQGVNNFRAPQHNDKMLWRTKVMIELQDVYEVRSRKDHRAVDLVSGVLPFGQLLYGGSNAITHAIGYAQFYSRSHNAVNPRLR